jgi:RNA polymerase primary sigma factor
VAEAAGQDAANLSPDNVIRLGSLMINELAKHEVNEAPQESSENTGADDISHLLIAHMAMRGLGADEIAGRIGSRTEPGQVVPILKGLAIKIKKANLPKTALVADLISRKQESGDTEPALFGSEEFDESSVEAEESPYSSDTETNGPTLEELKAADQEIDRVMIGYDAATDDGIYYDEDDPEGVYFSQLGQIEVLSADEQKRLAVEAKVNPESRRKLVESNLKFVVKVATRFNTPGMQLIDLVQEGSIGLLEAVDSYRPIDGVRFITYAWWHIRKSIRRAIDDKAEQIKVPVKVTADRRKIFNVSLLLEQQLGRTPTIPELASVSGLSVERIGYVFEKDYMQPVSVETPVANVHNENADLTIGRKLADTARAEDSRHVELDALKTVLEEVLQDGFSDEERYIIERRFGFYDGTEWTLSQIARSMGKAHQTMTPKMRKIKLKLSHPSRSSALRSFLYN